MAKILVIEDERSLREDMIEALNISAYEVAAAASGESGLALLHDYRPDLILCDVRMPGMNGFDVLKQVRTSAETATIPFIFITAQDDRESMRSGMALGADDYLTKPFSIEELVSAVQARLERRNSFVREAETKLEQAKLRLTRLVTHELKTPLVSMNSVLDIVSRRMGALSPDELQELLASIDSGGRRLTHLVDQMVLVTQLEAGVLQRALLPKNGALATLAQILNAAVNLGRRFSHGRTDVKIGAEQFEADVPILCYHQPLKHAFAELIANALNFSPPDGTVMIAGWRAGRAIWTTITDRGPGMTREQIEQAAQSFHQINREQQEQQGMGMGLMIAHQIITLHGGILEFQSEPGQGTQVQVGLPVVLVSKPAQ